MKCRLPKEINSEEELLNLKLYYRWYIISECSIKENLIRKYINELNLYLITVNSKLSEEFIEEYKDKLSWFNVIKFQTLSESFIKKYIKLGYIQDRDLTIVVKYQKISDQFAKKYKKKIDWFNVIMNITSMKLDFNTSEETCYKLWKLKYFI